MFGQSFEETEYKELPIGNYAVFIDNVVISESAKKKTPCLNFTLKVADGQFKDRTIYHTLWFTEGAYNMTAGQLSKLLVFEKIKPAADIVTWMNNAADLVYQLVNKKIDIKISGYDESDNGKRYPNTWITGFLDTPNHAIQTVLSGTVDAQQQAGTSTTASPTTAGSETSFDTSEEIPF